MDREQKKIAFKTGYIYTKLKMEKNAGWINEIGNILGGISGLGVMGLVGIPAALGMSAASVAKDFTGARKSDVDDLEEAIIQDYYQRRIKKEIDARRMAQQLKYRRNPELAALPEIPEMGKSEIEEVE